MISVARRAGSWPTCGVGAGDEVGVEVSDDGGGGEEEGGGGGGGDASCLEGSGAGLTSGLA